jgi:hypothetical protein
VDEGGVGADVLGTGVAEAVAESGPTDARFADWLGLRYDDATAARWEQPVAASTMTKTRDSTRRMTELPGTRVR